MAAVAETTGFGQLIASTVNANELGRYDAKLSTPVEFLTGRFQPTSTAHTLPYSNPHELKVRITRLAEAASSAS
jgi:hypothetical protein